MKRTTATLILLALSACKADARISSEYEQLEVPMDRIASDEARARGREIYRSKCALCHGKDADGRGARRKGLSHAPTSFQRPQWRQSVTPKYVFQVLSEGKQGTSMPAWPTLTEEQRWDVVAYLLSVAEDGP
ncbi:MAG TPA: cytochrome c [Polyangiales bacterium]|nr:cytochrome c [Polyangiales bacterium]